MKLHYYPETDTLYIELKGTPGAEAREMLIQAAAQKWGVDKSQCRAENGSVINASTNARLSYGALAEANARAAKAHRPAV